MPSAMDREGGKFGQLYRCNTSDNIISAKCSASYSHPYSHEKETQGVAQAEADGDFEGFDPQLGGVR